jgi:hypothetical protein
MERIDVRVNAGLKKQLEAEARKRGVRPSEIVRQALEEHLRQRTPRESAYELAKHLGLIGSAKGLPPDLRSANGVTHFSKLPECGWPFLALFLAFGIAKAENGLC